MVAGRRKLNGLAAEVRSQSTTYMWLRCMLNILVANCYIVDGGPGGGDAVEQGGSLRRPAADDMEGMNSEQWKNPLCNPRLIMVTPV